MLRMDRAYVPQLAKDVAQKAEAEFGPAGGSGVVLRQRPHLEPQQLPQPRMHAVFALHPLLRPAAGGVDEAAKLGR